MSERPLRPFTTAAAVTSLRRAVLVAFAPAIRPIRDRLVPWLAVNPWRVVWVVLPFAALIAADVLIRSW